MPTEALAPCLQAEWAGLSPGPRAAGPGGERHPRRRPQAKRLHASHSPELPPQFSNVVVRETLQFCLPAYPIPETHRAKHHTVPLSPGPRSHVLLRRPKCTVSSVQRAVRPSRAGFASTPQIQLITVPLPGLPSPSHALGACN